MTYVQHAGSVENARGTLLRPRILRSIEAIGGTDAAHSCVQPSYLPLRRIKALEELMSRTFLPFNMPRRGYRERLWSEP